MRHAALFLPLLLALLRLAVPAEAATALRIGGTGGAVGTMRLLAEAYRGEHPEVAARVPPSLGSGGGIIALAEGAIDLAVVSRPLTEGEKAFGFTVREFGRTPFVFITHPACSIRNLTAAQVADFYKGAVETCSCGSRLRLVLRSAGDSDNTVLRSISSAVAEAVENALARPGMLIAVSDQEAASVVAGGPGRVGTSTLALVLSEKEEVAFASFNGVVPSVASLRDGTYPLSKTFTLVTQALPSPEVARFLSFLDSPTARRILEENGILPATGEAAGQ